MKKTRKIPFYLFTFIFLMIFISAGAAPDKPLKTGKKNIKSEHMYRKVNCKRAPMKEYKKITGYNKCLNKPRRAS